MVCMSNKSILFSLVAGVQFSYYVSVTISPITLFKNLCGDVGLSSNIKQSLILLVQQTVSDYRDILD